MRVEFFGPPGSGKSTVFRNLVAGPGMKATPALGNGAMIFIEASSAMPITGSRLRRLEKTIVRGCRRLGLFHADAKEECRWRLDLSSHRELVSRFLELYRGDGKDPRRSLRCVELFWDDLLRIEAERMLRARHERDVVFVFDELLFHRIIMNFLWHEQGAEAVDELLSLAPRSDIYVQVGAPAEIAMSPVHERDRGRRDARQVQRYEDLIDRALHHIGESGAELIEIDGRMPPQRAAEMLAERLPAIASARQSERRLSPGGGRTAGAAPALRLTGGARRP